MKTTKEDFELFKSDCLHWIEFFGLQDWMVSFLHEKDGEALAWVNVDYDNSTATISFNKDWIDNKVFYKEEEIRMIAFHEVSELLISELDTLARERYGVTEDRLLKARHKFIHRMENSVFRKLKEVMS